MNRSGPESRRLRAGLVLAAIGFPCGGWALGAPTAGAPVQLAKISAIQNIVETRPASAGSWSASTPDQPLFGRDRVRTGVGSRAAILYSDLTLHRVNEKSEVEILPPEQDSPGILKVLSGQHYFSSRKPKNFGRVETPTVTAAIKGTEFSVSVDADGATTITMLEGVVEASNEFGAVQITAGEQAVARRGAAPVRSVVVRPRDAVAWAFYYPPVLGGADAARLRQMGESGAGLERAAQLLSVGQVSEATGLIESARSGDPRNPIAMALASVVALVADRRDEARRLAEEALVADANSPAAALAASFAAQADFDIDRAAELAERAARLDPEEPAALARAAELRMARGDVAGARRAAEEALQRSPEDARALSVLGFVELSALRADEAARLFERAVQADPGLSLARMGLGLARIRLGDLSAGREQLQTAAALDPTNSLMRSYLGKAYYEEKRTEEAEKEYAAAKLLDPSDPTPWLYASMLAQNTNRPVEALEEIRGSIERNDRRAVYRSRFLLDEDLAVRSADLARIYNDLGFEQLGLVAARQSADEDHANHSSHLFLAGAYRGLADYAPAFLSETLQARIYQPVSVNAVRPDVVNDSASLNEYSALLDRPRWRVFGGVAYGETDEDLTDLIPPDQMCYDPVLGEVPCVSLVQLDGSNASGQDITVTNNGQRYAAAISYRGFTDDGFRRNADQENDNFRGFFQYATSDRDTIQVNALYGERDTGDLPLREIAALVTPERFATEETNIGAGWHRRLGPGSDVAVSAIWNRTEQTGSIIGAPISATATLEGPQLEAQYVKRRGQATWIAGAGAFDGSVRLDSSGSSLEGDDSFLNGYLYLRLRGMGPFELTAGASVERVDAPVGLIPPRDAYMSPANLSFSETKWSPKLGASLALRTGTTLRAAVYHRMSAAIGRLQTLEPTQVAGFNQFYEEPGGTRSWTYGLGFDQALGRHFFFGATAQRRDRDIPEASCEAPDQFSGCNFQPVTAIVDKSSEDDLASVYANATLGRRLAASIEYGYERSEFDYTSVTQLGLFEDYARTVRLRPEVRWFMPFGLFAGAAGTHYDQTVEQFDDFQSENRYTQDADFWVVDVSVGYRFPGRWGAVVLEGRNVANQEFVFYDRSIQDQVIPARQIIARLEVTY